MSNPIQSLIAWQLEKHLGKYVEGLNLKDYNYYGLFQGLMTAWPMNDSRV